MTPQSRKAKGRGLVKKLKDKLLRHYPDLEDEDLKITSSGETGEDLQLSPAARAKIPYQFECKKHKTFAIYKHYEQARSHGKHTPVVVIEADHETPLVVLSLDHFLEGLHATEKV
jgi:hypothetical protein